MSIWDNMKRTEQPVAKETARRGETFTIHFSTESVTVPVGSTLRDALMAHRTGLGYDGSRTVTWRDARGVVPETTLGQAGVEYTASISLETKGL